MKHPFEPVYDENSTILILGTFPSVKSREANFYYAHPRNRFWKVIGAIIGETMPETVEAKKAMLLMHHIALWDVVSSCDIAGSDDTSISNVIPNNLDAILAKCGIRLICTNGRTAENLYRLYIQPYNGREQVSLPSTSPANAAYSLERLVRQWNVIRQAGAPLR